MFDDSQEAQGGLTPRNAVRQDTETINEIAADAGEPEIEEAPAPLTPGVETGRDVPVENLGGVDQPAPSYGAPGMRGMNDPAALLQEPTQGPKDGLADAEHLDNTLR